MAEGVESSYDVEEVVGNAQDSCLLLDHAWEEDHHEMEACLLETSLISQWDMSG